MFLKVLSRCYLELVAFFYFIMDLKLKALAMLYSGLLRSFLAPVCKMDLCLMH